MIELIVLALFAMAGGHTIADVAVGAVVQAASPDAEDDGDGENLDLADEALRE